MVSYKNDCVGVPQLIFLLSPDSMFEKRLKLGKTQINQFIRHPQGSFFRVLDILVMRAVKW